MKISSILPSLLFILLVLFSTSCSDTPAHESLFNNYFEPQPATNLFASRSVPDEPATKEEIAKTKKMMSNSAKGIEAYNNHQYDEAIKYFATYMDLVGNKNEEINFYLGVSYLAENQVEKAKEIFTRLSKKSSKVRKAEAEWYLVLTLLKDNDISGAEKGLNKIVKKKKHRYHEKALSLKQKIEKHLASLK